LILGGNTPPPISGAVLGGMSGLCQRFGNGNIQQKIKILSQALVYEEEGINFLIEALNDPKLMVKINAYIILHNLNSDSDTIQQELSQDILLNPGDRVYSVYESVISYNDWCGVVGANGYSPRS
jgi:hypothetical protein